MKQKKDLMELTPEERELIEAVRNYNKSYPDGYPQLLLYAPGQTHQNYSDKNCNISNCKTLIINVLDLLILDIFRIFIV